MNKKAESFQKYLSDNKITKVFAVEELHDTWDTVLFRSRLDIHGNYLPTVIIFDKTVYGIIRVVVVPQAVSEANELEILRFAAAANKHYKAFKYYFDDNGALILDVTLVGKDSDGDMVYAMLDTLIEHLSVFYKEIMQVVWR